MRLSNASHGWRIPNELWTKVQPLLPPSKPHPLGCHRPRVDDRKAMDAIFYRLRTGCQWKALDATGICSSSTAHRRFQEWTRAGVFRQLWTQGLLDYDELKGLDWEWQAMDGAMSDPRHWVTNRPDPTPRTLAKRGVKRSLLVEGHGLPIGLAIDGATRNDFKMTRRTLESIPFERERKKRKPSNATLVTRPDVGSSRTPNHSTPETLRLTAPTPRAWTVTCFTRMGHSNWQTSGGQMG
jgi:putative transposase